VDREQRTELARLYNRTRETTDALQAKAVETLELTQRLERLTKDTTA